MSQGFTRPDGPTGAAGADGADGVGVPAGGTTGQVLEKVDATDYNTQWAATSTTDADAIHDNVSGEIAAVTEKASPVSADLILIEDSAASNVKKRVQVGNLPGGSSSPLTTKGDLYGYDSADARLAIGTDDYVLTADSTQALGLKWAAASGSSPLTTKGDLHGYSTVDARLPVGTNDQVLTADSTETLGVKWAAASSGGGSDWSPILDTKTTADDPPDDEFDSSTLNARWTAVQGSSGTVDLLETTAVSKYDLSTRSGMLLMQAGGNSSQEVSFRQDYTLPDGKSIIMALEPAMLYDVGLTNNDWWSGLTLNSNDAAWDASTTRATLHCEPQALGKPSVFAYDGSVVSGYIDWVAPGRFYFRIARDGTEYYFFFSQTGMAWHPLGHKTLTTAPNNVWIHMDVKSTTNYPCPITAVDWIRLGTNSLDPWS